MGAIVGLEKRMNIEKGVVRSMASGRAKPKTREKKSEEPDQQVRSIKSIVGSKRSTENREVNRSIG